MEQLTPEIQEKWEELLGILNKMQSAVIAFSGGVDSGLLSVAAYQALGEHMLAVTIQSPVDPPGEVEAAQILAEQIGFRHEILQWNDLESHRFAENPPDRCYYCKSARLTALQGLAQARGYTWTAEGSNVDDSKDYRPGTRAVLELGVRSPLVEAGITKSEIRKIARYLNLKIWDKPSAPCLATRFPYGSEITVQKLEQVRNAEIFLMNRGFLPVRVRHEGALARIEIEPAELPRLISIRQEIIEYLKSIGFQYVTVDLQGYRQGSMNEVLDK